MKKIIYLILFSLFLNVNLAHATVGWSKNIPATSENPQAISPDVIENNTAVDLMLQNYRDGGVYVKLISTSEIDIGPGGVMLSNSGGSTRLMVANAALTAVSSTMIDTGTISASSTYYLYAYASSTTATTFSVIFSASATSPIGITYYAKLGSFTTNGSSNFFSASSNINSQIGFGSQVSESANTIYQASADTIVIGAIIANSGSGQGYFYTDNSSNPTTEQSVTFVNSNNINAAPVIGIVKKGNYWTLTLSGSSVRDLFAITIGS